MDEAREDATPQDQATGPLSQPSGPYSRDEVIGAGRPAASYVAGTENAVWHYDGETFWIILDHRCAVCGAEVAPRDGWWHADGCACELCQAAGLA